MPDNRTGEAAATRYREARLIAPLRRVFGFAAEDDSRWFADLAEHVREPSLGRIGSFRLIAEAGRGGQGLVYRARQERPARDVALKRLAAGVFATAGMRARFEREIESAAALDHPNIVRIYGVESIDGQLVVVMQWIDGTSLHRWARPAGLDPRSDAEIVDVFIAICEAVCHAHERGIIHRDLKPSNILVDAAGQPHVLDFGLARRTDDDSGDAGLTREGAFLGTPMYAPPEQLRGNNAKIDARSDVYSLGAMLYQCLTGSTPVEPHLSPQEMLRQIERFGPRSPKALSPGLDRDLCTIVLKALSVEPERRYAAVADLQADLTRFRRGEPVMAHPGSAVYRLRKFARRHRRGILVAGSVAAMLVGAWMIAASNVRRARDAEQRSILAQRHKELLDANAALDAQVAQAWQLDKAGKKLEAEQLLRTVYAKRRELVGSDHRSLAEVALDLGERLRHAEVDAAAPLLEQAMRIARREYGNSHPTAIKAAGWLAYVRLGTGDYRAAEQLSREILEATAGAPGEIATPEAIAYQVNYVLALLDSRWPDARAAADRHAELNKRVYGRSHRYFTHWVYWSAAAQRLAGDDAGARITVQPVLTVLEPRAASRLTQKPPAGDRFFTFRDVGVALTLAGRLNDAEPFLRRSFELCRRGNDLVTASRNGSAYGALGECLARQGRFAEAEPLLLNAISSIATADYLHWRIYYAYVLIEMYESLGHTESAKTLRNSLATLPPPSWQAGPAVFPSEATQSDSSAPAAGLSTSAPASDEDVEEVE